MSTVGSKTYCDISRAWLLLCIHHLAMVNDHGKASKPAVLFPANFLAEIDLGIAQKQLLPTSVTLQSLGCAQETYDIVVLDTICLAPSIHDPSIIHCDDSNLVDTLAHDFIVVLEVAGKVANRTTRGKSTRYSEEDNFLVGELL